MTGEVERSEKSLKVLNKRLMQMENGKDFDDNKNMCLGEMWLDWVYVSCIYFYVNFLDFVFMCKLIGT